MEQIIEWIHRYPYATVGLAALRRVRRALFCSQNFTAR